MGSLDSISGGVARERLATGAPPAHGRRFSPERQFLAPRLSEEDRAVHPPVPAGTERLSHVGGAPATAPDRGAFGRAPFSSRCPKPSGTGSPGANRGAAG